MWNNVGKTVHMVYCSCQASGTQLEAAYGRRMTGEGTSYRDRKKRWVQCREWGEEMAAGLMSGHMKTQHGRAAEERCSCTTLAMGEEPRTYRMDFLVKGGPRRYPVEGCLGRLATMTEM